MHARETEIRENAIPNSFQYLRKIAEKGVAFQENNTLRKKITWNGVKLA